MSWQEIVGILTVYGGGAALVLAFLVVVVPGFAERLADRRDARQGTKQ